MALARCVVLGCAVLVGAALATGQRLLGAPALASENDTGVRHALQFAMKQYNRASNDVYGSRVAEIVSVKKQIVSGVKYFLEVKVRRTTCTKAVTDIETCAFHETPRMARQETCNFVVYSIPWLNEISLVENRCRETPISSA